MLYLCKGEVCVVPRDVDGMKSFRGEYKTKITRKSVPYCCSKDFFIMEGHARYRHHHNAYIHNFLLRIT